MTTDTRSTVGRLAASAQVSVLVVGCGSSAHTSTASSPGATPTASVSSASGQATSTAAAVPYKQAMLNTCRAILAESNGLRPKASAAKTAHKAQAVIVQEMAMVTRYDNRFKGITPPAGDARLHALLVDVLGNFAYNYRAALASLANGDAVGSSDYQLPILKALPDLARNVPADLKRGVTPPPWWRSSGCGSTQGGLLAALTGHH